jgi:hypothetical protein
VLLADTEYPRCAVAASVLTKPENFMDNDAGEPESISVERDCKIREWATRLGCTERDLREAVKAVGNLISLEHDDEIRDWAMSLCCTEAELRAAVKAVGCPEAVGSLGGPLFKPGEFNDV